jgi:hypothetical protein
MAHDDNIDVTVGRSGIGAAMMQMNRTMSVDDSDDATLDVMVGRSGIGAAMMQMNRAMSVDTE